MRKAGESAGLFLLERIRSGVNSARGRGSIAAEDAEFTGGFANCSKGFFEPGEVESFDVDEKLVFPGTTVDGAAFNLEEIYAVLREGFERGKERSRAMREAHREGDLASVRGQPCGGLLLGEQENKARKILGVVLDAFGEDRGAIMLGGAAPGNGGSGFVAAKNDFADAAGGVFRRNALPFGMRGEETFALRERHGV